MAGQLQQEVCATAKACSSASELSCAQTPSGLSLQAHMQQRSKVCSSALLRHHLRAAL